MTNNQKNTRAKKLSKEQLKTIKGGPKMRLNPSG